MPGWIQLTAQVPRDSSDLPATGTMEWFPDRKVVWAECTQPVAKYDLLVFDMDSLPLRDLTVFDRNHPWNFVHPARVAYDESEVFTVSYVSFASSPPWVLGEVMTQVTAPGTGTGIIYNFTETITEPEPAPVRSGQITYRLTAGSFANNDEVSGAGGFTGNVAADFALHGQYMGPLWKFGVAQSAGVVGQRIPVQTRGITQLACVAGTTSAQIMIPDEDLPQATPKATTTDPVMQIARTLTSVSGGLCWVVFNGERGHGTNLVNE